MEPYNYVFNKRTAFTDSDFITFNSDELDEILKHMEDAESISDYTGADQLSILNYTRPRIIEDMKQ
jgi:hypothetical protein